MRLVFNRRKAAQAAACLVHHHGGRMNLMALIKLLYLADRTALIEIGYTITGDRMVNMPKGPVLSQIYDSIKWGDQGDGDPWYEYLSERDGHDVLLRRDETDELSMYELDVLARVHEAYGRLDRFDLVRLTHRLPEWKDPEGSSIPLDPVEILKAAGKSDAEIERLTNEAEEIYFLNSVGRLTPVQQ